jgi:O-antigen/teichoic acid export membrane protein
VTERVPQSRGRQLSVITIDQAIAGGSNVLIAVIAARLLSAASFGLFALVVLTYIVAQSVSRALICDPLLVHPLEAEERKGEVIGASCLLGLAVGGAVLLVGVVVSTLNSSLGLALIVLGALLPLLVIQDLGRYLGFALERPSRALVLDTTWLLLLAVAVVPLFVTDTKSLAWLTAAWAGSGACAGLLTFVQHHGSQIRLRLAWLRYTWGFSWRNLISYTAQQGGLLAAASAVGAIAGAAALGGLQGATLLLRPCVTVQIAVTAGTMGHVARALGVKATVRRYVRHASLLTTAAALVNSAVVLALPDGVGRAILGDTWEVAQPLLLAAGVQFVFLSVMAGPRAGLLGTRAIRKILAIDILSTALVVASSIAGADINGALGALWGIAITQGVIAVVMWIAFLRHTPDRTAKTAAPAEPPPVTVPAPPAV